MGYRVQREFGEGKALIRLVAGRWWAAALHHSPNEEMSPTARQLAAASGTKAGFPDYILPIQSGEFVGLAIELKAAKPHGRAPTPKQKAWLEHLDAQGWRVVVAFGAEEAIAAFDDYIGLGAEPPPS